MNAPSHPVAAPARWHLFLRHPPLPDVNGLCYGRLDLPLPGSSFEQAAARLHTRFAAGAAYANDDDRRQHRHEYGHDEQDRIATALRRLPLLTSPAQRCFGFAQAWHHRNGHARSGRLAPKIDLRLQEMHFGAWEGLAWASIPRADLDRWAEDVVGYRPPDGESFADLIARVGDALAELREPHTIVTHGGAIRAAWHLLGGVPAETAASMTIAYAEPILIGAP